MKSKPVLIILMGFIVIYPLLSVYGAGDSEGTLSTGSVLETVINDSQLKSMDELRGYLHAFPQGTPYLDKIELRTETEDFDADKQKFSLRFYPKGWGETAGTKRLRKTRNQSHALAFEERFHKALKDRYDLIVDYLEIRTLMDIEKELLVNLEDQIRVLQALGPGDINFDVGRLIDAQDDRTTYQLNQIEREDRLTGLIRCIRQLTGCDHRFAIPTTGLITVADIRVTVTDLVDSAKASSSLNPLLAERPDAGAGSRGGIPP